MWPDVLVARMDKGGKGAGRFDWLAGWISERMGCYSVMGEYLKT